MFITDPLISKNFEVLYLSNYTFAMPVFILFSHNFSSSIILYKFF